MKVLEYIGWYGYDRIIGVSLQPEEGRFNMARLIRSKDNWELLAQATGLSKKELIKELNHFPAWPLCVFIDVQEVVVSNIPFHTQDIFSAVMGIQVEDNSTFVAQQIPLENEQLSVALIRKDRLIAVSESLSEFSGRIVSLSFHPGVIWPLEDLEGVKEGILPAMGAVAQHTLARGKDLLGWLPPFEQDQQFSRYLKLLKTGAILAAGLLFILVLSVLGAFWLIHQNNQAELNISKHQAILTKLADQQYEIQQHQDFLTKAEKSREQTVSYLTYALDQLLTYLPPDIFLDKYLCFPTEKELRQWMLDQGRKDISRDIWIAGWSSESASLSAFLSSLSRGKLFEGVQIISSTYDHASRRYEFVISLNLKHE
ncbi:MAG: hypothetical protein AAGC85_04285 [Bacteroidota bacterium]